MIKKIAIVPYVTYGRLAQAGHDGHLNPFKKKRSAALKENLEAALSAEKWDMEVIIDVNPGDLPGQEQGPLDERLLSLRHNFNFKEICSALSLES